MSDTPLHTALYSAPKVFSVAGALSSATSIKTSIASATSAQNYSGAALNGTLGGTLTKGNCGRTVTVTTSASAATYVTGAGNPIVVTGTDSGGNAIIENLLLTAAGGGETIVGLKDFQTVTSIAIPAQLGTGGAFTFGVQDIVLPSGCRGLLLGNGTTGTLKVTNALDATIDTIPGNVARANPNLPVVVSKVWGDAGTTQQDVTILF